MAKVWLHPYGIERDYTNALVKATSSSTKKSTQHTAISASTAGRTICRLYWPISAMLETASSSQ